MNRILMMGGAVVLTTALAFAQAKPPQVKSQKEAEAVMAVFNAQTADARIAAADDLIAKFADTEFKPIVLQLAADAYERKGDAEKTIIYSERALEADPKNYPAMLMISRALVSRTREHDFDREEKLNRSDKLAKEAMELAKVAPKPRPDLPDEQWEAAKKDFVAQSHEALAMAAKIRKKNDVAIAEFKAALETSSQPDPATMVRLAGAYNEAGKPDEAIALIDKVDAMPNLHPAIKQVGANERAKAMRAKGGTAAPKPAAAPSATPGTASPAPATAPGTPSPAPAAPKQ